MYPSLFIGDSMDSVRFIRVWCVVRDGFVYTKQGNLGQGHTAIPWQVLLKLHFKVPYTQELILSDWNSIPDTNKKYVYIDRREHQVVLQDYLGALDEWVELK